MLCTSCGQDREPIIEGDQSGRFQYTCGNAGCHSNLGPVVREHTQPKVVPLPVPHAAAATPPGARPQTLADVGPSLVESIRRRIELLDVELAKAEAMRVERKMLARMLRAAERKEPKQPQSNVVPIARGAT
jgi:hypothetical protein